MGLLVMTTNGQGKSKFLEGNWGSRPKKANPFASGASFFRGMTVRKLVSEWSDGEGMDEKENDFFHKSFGVDDWETFKSQKSEWNKRERVHSIGSTFWVEINETLVGFLMDLGKSLGLATTSVRVKICFGEDIEVPTSTEFEWWDTNFRRDETGLFCDYDGSSTTDREDCRCFRGVVARELL